MAALLKVFSADAMSFRRFLLLTLPLIALVSYPLTVHAAPLARDTGAYAYYATNTPVAKVLADFCANFGIRLKLGRDISDKLNGRLNAPTPSEFLNQVTSTLGLTWFYYNGTLYVSRAAEWQTRTLAVPKGAVTNLKQAMIDLGVFDAKFGWATMPDPGLVFLSGPREYIDLVDATVQSLRVTPGGKQIALFRLKHANATDRTVDVRGTSIVIPGVVTILRSLAGSGQSSASPRVRTGGDANRIPPNGGGAVDGSGGTKMMNVSDDARPAASEQVIGSELGSGATIETDTRLNALIIKDTPEALAMYQKLIEAIDVPVALVEIEAMTVDISKTRLSELGIDWTIAGNHKLSATLGNNEVVPTAGALSLGYNTNAVTLVGNQAAALIAKIKLLETKGDAKVVGKPFVLTTDNLIAVIDLSQTFYVPVQGERVATLTPVTTGVMLKVAPHVISHGKAPAEIRLVVDIQDGALVNRTGLSLPLVQQSSISTQATILENQSLLIGGYDRTADSNSTAGVPGLSNLPVIGGLFRNNIVQTDDTKRLFLITPRIVNIDNGGPDKTDSGIEHKSSLRRDSQASSAPLSPALMTSAAPPALSVKESASPGGRTLFD
ncbi:type III secretion system outer membrane ring subunit SctC [Noviherbaspirillum sp.]|uniref:type III secretion system outer membrane ring subunit SctC n=1 Tax=Noviherbaspirillum sp. TaxID=1926288 RepID=UPI002B477F1C|nr:type III secretion system outer membrane ring subunit SctC [Noviherbaspirillum sp.]HJV80591.1 type III secretion system outer membrane ring subunit SctC [Noviherbaspirillum sp.]